MTNSVPSVSPVEIGVATGLLGAGIGYLAAPRKYNLEDILTQKPDVFEKAVPKNLLVSEAEHDAYNAIVDARTALVNSAKSNTAEAKLSELTKSKANKEAYRIIRSIIPKTRAKTAAIVGVISGLAAVFTRYLTDTNN